MTIGVGVEGPSDRAFWNKVLHKYFQGTRFDIRSMNGREQLIRQAPQLLETFRDAHYEAGFLVLDAESSPCPTAVVGEFEPAIQAEARRPLAERYLHVAVAFGKIEAWYLADADAMNAVLPNANYNAPPKRGMLARQD